jgi:hypothetical protein
MDRPLSILTKRFPDLIKAEKTQIKNLVKQLRAAHPTTYVSKLA